MSKDMSTVALVAGFALGSADGDDVYTVFNARSSGVANFDEVMTALALAGIWTFFGGFKAGFDAFWTGCSDDGVVFFDAEDVLAD